MPDFSKRSYETELLDRDDIPFADIQRNMEELDFINRRLGGHKITLDGFRHTVNILRQKKRNNNEPVSIMEIGCGGGDNLRVVKEYCHKRSIAVQLTGVDINPHCINFAKSRPSNANIAFITSDYRLVQPNPKPDIVFSSLFCHHFRDEGVVEILAWMKTNAEAFFINDLHRHPLAYYSIMWLTRLFSKSYLVKNDAPLSVMRGFTRKEWESLARQCGLENAQLKWKWAFRWLMIHCHE